MVDNAQLVSRRRRQAFAALRVVNRPARYPEHGIWPCEMRADVAAAFLDYRTTREMMAAIVGGDAPKATAIRGEGKSREPVWHIDKLREFLATRHDSPIDGASGGKPLRDIIAGHHAIRRGRP